MFAYLCVIQIFALQKRSWTWERDKWPVIRKPTMRRLRNYNYVKNRGNHLHMWVPWTVDETMPAILTMTRETIVRFLRTRGSGWSSVMSNSLGPDSSHSRLCHSTELSIRCANTENRGAKEAEEEEAAHSNVARIRLFGELLRHLARNMRENDAQGTTE